MAPDENSSEQDPTGAVPAVRLTGVSKRFPGVAAVSEVDLDLQPGQVHVFAGENGAGKSTLMKLIAQVERPSSGRIELHGEPVQHHGIFYGQHIYFYDRSILPLEATLSL